MKFIDMFAGIGGFHSGMEQAGHQCVGWIEWDKYARKSYQAIYNTEGIYNAEDIQTVRGRDLPDADVWCFGSPCTNVSISGNRKGITGEASRMFFEVIRLLTERAENHQALPAYLFMENVKALLSSNGGRDFARVLTEMEQAGYDVEWSVINSAEVVPQNRERVYLVGHLRGTCTRPVFPIGREGATVSGQPTIRIAGNVSRTGHNSDNVMQPDGISKTVTAQNAYKHPLKVLVKAPRIKQVGNYVNGNSFGGNPTAGRVYSPGGISPTLNTMGGGNREPAILTTKNGVMAIRKLTPLECWRLQGFSDEQFYRAKDAGVSNSQLYKQAGNAVTVPVIKAIAERLRAGWE